MKDGGMNRDPRPVPSVKTFKHGPKQTITKMDVKRKGAR